MSSVIPQREKLAKFGFWKSSREPDLLDPVKFVDQAWDPEERSRVIEYIKSSHTLDICCGYSWCRFECGCEDSELGTHDLTDGVWLFPQGLSHYIERHGVKPSRGFLRHIRENNYSVPEVPGLMGLQGVAWVLYHIEPDTEDFKDFRERWEEILKIGREWTE